MDWISRYWLPLLFIGGYLALLARHAWIGGRKSRSLEEYLVGGRRLGGVLIALSFYATFVSSVTFIGHAGKSYTRGPAWWIICVVVFTTMVLLAWFVVAPPFMRNASRFQALTIPDFLGKRYQSTTLRRLAGVVVVTASLVYMTAVYDGAARSLESLLEIDSHLVMAAIFLVVTAYTLSGGFHSVVATDAVQGCILFFAAITLPSMMVWRKGGIGPLLQSVREANPRALDWTGELPLITMIGLALGVGVKFIVEPRQLSRFYGLASHRQLRRGRLLAPLLLFLTYLLMLPVGFLAHAFVKVSEVTGPDGKIETDSVTPYLLGPEANILGPVLGAFFLTGLAAAAMSSLDSVLLVAASSVDHDILKPGRWRPEGPGRASTVTMRWTRFWVLLLSAAAAAAALLRLQGIVEMSAFSGSIYAACFFPPLVVGLFWKGGTRVGALSCMVIGFFVTIIWFYAKKSDLLKSFAWLHEVYLGTGVSLLCYLTISWINRIFAKPPLGEES